MPLITIKTLPFEQDMDVPGILKSLGLAIVEKTGLGPDRFVLSWEYLSPDHVLYQGKLAEFQPKDTHHPMVGITTLKGMQEDVRTCLMETIAVSLSGFLDMPKENICVFMNPLESGHLYVFGKFMNASGE